MLPGNRTSLVLTLPVISHPASTCFILFSFSAFTHVKTSKLIRLVSQRHIVCDKLAHMPPKARSRPRSAPPAQRTRHENAQITSEPLTRSRQGDVLPLSEESLVPLKRFAKHMQHLEESARHSMKTFHAFLASLQASTRALCDCVSTVSAVQASPASRERLALSRLALRLEQAQKTWDESAEVTLWDSQLERLVVGARELSAAAHAVRTSNKTLQSAVRKSRTADKKKPSSSTSPASPSARRESKHVAALSAAEKSALDTRSSFETLVGTRLQDMLYGYGEVVPAVAEKLAASFRHAAHTERGTQTDSAPGRVSRSTQTAAEASSGVPSSSPSQRRQQPPRQTAPTRPVSTTGANVSGTVCPQPPPAAVAPQVSTGYDTSPVLQTISRAFDSLFGRFSAAAAPSTSSGAAASSSSSGQARTERSPPPQIPGDRVLTVQRGVIVSGGRHETGWRSEGLPPPQYPEYLFSSGDLFSSVQPATTPPRREW